MNAIRYIFFSITLLAVNISAMEEIPVGRLNESAHVVGQAISPETTRAIEVWRKTGDKLRKLKQIEEEKPLLSRLFTVGLPATVGLLCKIFPDGVPSWNGEQQTFAAVLLIGGTAVTLYGYDKILKAKEMDTSRVSIVNSELPPLREAFQSIKVDARTDAKALLLLQTPSYQEWQEIKSKLD